MATIDTSQKTEELITPQLWDSMTLKELYDQMEILNTRMNTVLESKNNSTISIRNQLQKGIDRLRHLIDGKNDSIIY